MVQGSYVSDLGVSLVFLKDFAAEHVVEIVRDGWTTGQVNKALVLPAAFSYATEHGLQDESSRTQTGSMACISSSSASSVGSYAERGRAAGLRDSAGRPAFAKATAFVSQSWHNPFGGLVASLEAWMDETKAKPEETYFFLDLFCVRPGRGGWRQPEAWWSERYMKTIGNIGSTVVVAEPWNSPSTFVGPWCIWQLYCTTVTGARLHLTMSPSQRADFVQSLTRSFENVRTALCEIRVGFAEEDLANSPGGERHHIIEQIQRVVSFERLDEVLQTRLRHWLAQGAREELHKLQVEAKAKARVRSQEAWRQLNPAELSLRDHVGQLLREMGNLKEAEEYFRSLCADCEQRLGPDSAFTLAATNHLAVTLQKQRDPEKRGEAERLHRYLLERRQALSGDTNVVTLQSVSNLAEMLVKQFRSGAGSVVREAPDVIRAEARDLSMKALKGRQALLGLEDPRTLYTATTVAQLLSASIPGGTANDTDVREAESLHEEAAKGLSKSLGHGHPLALRSAQHLAEHRLFRAERDGDVALCARAHEELLEILARHTVALGREHETTGETRDMVNKARALQASLQNKDNNGGSLASCMCFDSELRQWREFQPECFPELNTEEQFIACRDMLRRYGVDRLLKEMQDLGFVDEDGLLTTTTKPFNVFARIGGGIMKQDDSMVADQELIGKHGERLVVACNRRECDENFESADPAWLGKASMAKHHRFLTTKDLHWRWFNVLVFGMLGNLEEAVQFVEDIKEAAEMYVRSKEGWPENVGLFFHVYALSSVNSLHLHIIDMDSTGPTFHKMAHKNLPLTAVLNVLKQELEAAWK